MDKKVKAIINATVKEIMDKLARHILLIFDQVYNRRPVGNYYAETEKLLYNYNILRQQVQEIIPDDIDDLRVEVITNRSKDVVFIPQGGVKSDKLIMQEDRIERRSWSLKRTKKYLAEFDKALGILKEDPGYCIIEMKYFQEFTIADIALSLNMSESTVKRKKNKLVRELSILLFGVDAV